MIQLTAEQVRWYRLRRSGLVEPFAAVETAVSTLAGIQAQILPAAAISLWNRTTGLTHARFEEMLFQDRSIVKLWGQRGTLHLYTSKEWPLFYGMMSEQLTWGEKQVIKSGTSLESYRATLVKLAEVLRQHPTLGRSDLRQSDFNLDEDHFSSWGGIFRDLVYRGYACHAQRVGSEGKFAHRDNWLPNLKWTPPPFDAANIEITWRHLHAYGPATIQDIAYWRGTAQRNVRKWLATLGEAVTEVEVEGQPMRALVHDLDALQETPPSAEEWPVHLLYRFEPILLGHKDKSWIIDMDFYKRIWRPAGHIEGIVLDHGRVVANWRYDRQGNGLVVTIKPFTTLRAAAKTAVSHRAQALARFFDLPLQDLIIE